MADPPRPASDKPIDLGFTPQPKMVPWLSPTQLLDTAKRVFLSATFGSYSDKREIEASLPCPPPQAYTGPAEMWFDYLADLGDAFGPTYTMAELLARPWLTLATPGGTPVTTPRGSVLVLGGDEVYPTASIRAYENQTVGPYRAALPYVENETTGPHLYAIPGNHDWYDGLTGFMRMFCSGQWVGGWQTKQTRSYFALQLPHNWWLWGIDVQFDSYIDSPQYDYFSKTVPLEKGDSVILCTPTPSWVDCNEEGGDEDFVTVDFLERTVIRAKEAEVRLAISGDAHHYARYAQTDGTAQRFTAGGGGAFLSATHHLPDTLVLPPPASRDPGKSKAPTHWDLMERYPTKKDSEGLRKHALELPVQNKGMWAFMGIVYVLLAWVAESAVLGGLATEPSFGRLAGRLVQNPIFLVIAAALFFGLAGFTKASDKAKKYGLGALHTVAHLLTIIAVIWAASRISAEMFESGGWFGLGVVVLVGVVGGLVGCEVMGLYLLVADRFGLNLNELFAAQRNRDWKNFLRIHVGPDGALTVYPVGVDRTPRRFRLNREGTGNDPWFVPEGDAVAVRLIEEPPPIDPAVPPAPPAPPPGPAAAAAKKGRGATA